MTNHPIASYRGFSCRELAKAIFDADVPEQVVRTLPAQSLFMVVKSNGLDSSTDLLEIATVDQCRLILDFDVWSGDSFDEESFWIWLALTDANNNLDFLQKLLKFVDLKLVALLIARHVDVITFEEATENPPGPGYHTPDRGSTWLGIKGEDANKHFLMARLLAMIFETSTELFYQLLATPGVATPSMLEEEAYMERMKRLAAEGVPEPQVAAGIHAPFSINEAMAEIDKAIKRMVLEDIPSVEPLLYESRPSKLLAALVADVGDKESFQAEFTFIMNAAVIRFGVDFSDQDQVLHLAEKVKGAINLGLEILTERTQKGLKEIYNALGLQKLYRIGFAHISQLRTLANKIPEEVIRNSRDDSVVFSTVACAKEIFPEMPKFYGPSGQILEEQGALVTGQLAIDSVSALNVVKNVLERLSA